MNFLPFVPNSKAWSQDVDNSLANSSAPLRASTGNGDLKRHSMYCYTTRNRLLSRRHSPNPLRSKNAGKMAASSSRKAHITSGKSWTRRTCKTSTSPSTGRSSGALTFSIGSRTAFQWYMPDAWRLGELAVLISRCGDTGRRFSM
jgi:hypothetical protein